MNTFFNNKMNHKQLLKQRGWSYRAAAPLLGVTYQHICLVMTGKRQSRRLLAKIEKLPVRETRKEAA